MEPMTVIAFALAGFVILASVFLIGFVVGADSAAKSHAAIERELAAAREHAPWVIIAPPDEQGAQA